MELQRRRNFSKPEHITNFKDATLRVNTHGPSAFYCEAVSSIKAFKQPSTKNKKRGNFNLKRTRAF